MEDDVSAGHAEDHEDDDHTAAQEGSTTDPLSPVRDYMGVMIAVLASVTVTFGNLAAFAQTNIKRLLAYSTIAHAGYMMMPVPAALALAKVAP